MTILPNFDYSDEAWSCQAFAVTPGARYVEEEATDTAGNSIIFSSLQQHSKMSQQRVFQSIPAQPQFDSLRHWMDNVISNAARLPPPAPPNREIIKEEEEEEERGGGVLLTEWSGS